jgi:hypothetical protein
MASEQTLEKRSSGTGFEDNKKMDSSDVADSQVETVEGISTTRKQVVRKIDTYLLPLVSLLLLQSTFFYAMLTRYDLDVHNLRSTST